jgi:hypothetical protein
VNGNIVMVTLILTSVQIDFPVSENLDFKYEDDAFAAESENNCSLSSCNVSKSGSGNFRCSVSNSRDMLMMLVLMLFGDEYLQ